MRQATSTAAERARTNCRRVLPLAAKATMKTSCKRILNATNASLAAYGCAL